MYYVLFCYIGMKLVTVILIVNCNVSKDFQDEACNLNLFINPRYFK